MSVITNLMLAVVIPPASSVSLKLAGWRWFSWPAVFCGWTGSAVYGTCYLATHGQWLWALAAGANAGLAIFLWWRRGRRRKRAPRAYGAKSRALVAALARKAREAAIPRPVLRPVPE